MYKRRNAAQRSARHLHCRCRRAHKRTLYERRSIRDNMQLFGQRGKGTLFPTVVITHRQESPPCTPLRGNGYATVRFTHPVRPGAHVFPVVQIGTGRLVALSCSRRIYMYKRDRRGHKNLYKAAGR